MKYSMVTLLNTVILSSPDLAGRFRGGVLKGVGLGRLGVEPEVPRPHHHNLGGTLLPRHLALGSSAIVSSCFVASKTFHRVMARNGTLSVVLKGDYFVPSPGTIAHAVSQLNTKLQ